MQSDAQRENTKTVLKHLFELWERRSSLYGSVLYCSAVAKDQDGKWRNVTSFLFPMHKDESRSIGVKADYGEFKLVEGTLTLEKAKTLLSEVVEQDRLCFPGLPEVGISVSLHPTLPSHFWDSGWRRFPIFFPYQEFSFNIEQEFKGQSPQGSLYGAELPLFPSGKETIEHFFCTGLGDNSSYSGLFSALAPDYRAKIKEVRIGTSSVEVQVLCLTGSSESQFVGKLYSQSYVGMANCADLNFTDGKASAKINDFPRDLLVAVLSRKDSELIDRRQFLSGSQYRAADVVVEAPEQDIEQTIQMGESDTVEFKREIPAKREVIAICAVALANHHGGMILIGVEDDCEVVGCHSNKEDTITQILRTHCDPFPPVFIEEVTVRDLPIIVVRVQEGSDKPYLVKDKGVYVRRGGTNRIATRYELDEMYASKQSLYHATD